MLRALPGVDDMEIRGETVLIESSDTDAVAESAPSAGQQENRGPRHRHALHLLRRFRTQQRLRHQTAGGNLTAFEVIRVALFGSVFATSTGGAMVSLERTDVVSSPMR